jgi:hypothetical protein
MLVRRILSLAALGAILAAAPLVSNPALARTATMPSLAGTWALYGTGPAGLVAKSGRLASMQIRQRGHTLTVTLHTGSLSYPATGIYYWLQPRVTLKWRMNQVGEVHFQGEVQAGGSRILGQWSNARGDDGGAYLTRIGP